MKRTSKAGAILAMLAGVSACDSEKEAAPAQPATAGPALVLRATDVPQWTPVSAEVATVDQALARIPGVLTSLSVSEGDYVRKGQAIGRIVDTSLAYQSGAYGSQAAAAQAQAAQASADLARTKFLYDNGVYAKARLDQAQAAASAAQAQVRAFRQQQASVAAIAGQGVVLAPASGKVLVADIPAGSAVAPGMAIATITAGPVVLKLDLPESLAKAVHPGSAISAAVADTGQVSGSVTRVYPSVVGGHVRADATIPGLDDKLIGGRVAARVEAGRRSALLVPRGFVTTRYGIDSVNVRSKSAVTAVPVQTAPSTEPGKVEILSGVAAGDTLVAPK
jgi:RND family efflux transporter MFP subunit